MGSIAGRRPPRPCGRCGTRRRPRHLRGHRPRRRHAGRGAPPPPSRPRRRSAGARRYGEGRGDAARRVGGRGARGAGCGAGGEGAARARRGPLRCAPRAPPLRARRGRAVRPVGPPAAAGARPRASRRTHLLAKRSGGPAGSRGPRARSFTAGRGPFAALHAPLSWLGHPNDAAQRPGPKVCGARRGRRRFMRRAPPAASSGHAQPLTPPPTPARGPPAHGAAQRRKGHFTQFWLSAAACEAKRMGEGGGVPVARGRGAAAGAGARRPAPRRRAPLLQVRAGCGAGRAARPRAARRAATARPRRRAHWRRRGAPPRATARVFNFRRAACWALRPPQAAGPAVRRRQRPSGSSQGPSQESSQCSSQGPRAQNSMLLR
jgi:hypothetical protein